MNKKIILSLVIISIIGAILYLENQNSTSNYGDVDSLKVSSQKDLSKVIDGVEYLLSPELTGISGYVNTEDKEIKISDFEGKVVLVDFWTYTCINCIRTLPYLTSWDEKYNDKGLVIIGIHAPEFEFEKDKDNVQKAIDKYGINYAVVQDNDKGLVIIGIHAPEFEFEKDKDNVQKAIDKYGINYAVVQDNDKVTWEAFNNRYWPAKYLIDSQGYIRYMHFGEGNYEETEKKIQDLLKEAGSKTSEIGLTEETATLRYKTTPELYAGAIFALPRGQYIGNKKTPGRYENYSLPIKLDEKNVIYLDGLWTHNAENLYLNGTIGTIALDFTASEVNIVAAPNEGFEDVQMDIFIDGNYIDRESAGGDVRFEANRAFITLDGDRLYNLYKGDYGNYRLDLKVLQGLSFNAFTFG